MPTLFRDDGAPVVRFDPALEISPFALFRRLREGWPLLLLDVRPESAEGGAERTLEGARPYPGEDWQPPPDRDVVLFDDDGSLALPLGRRLQGEGHGRVRILFGGLDLYEFSLDPRVVGQETYLKRRPG